MVSTCSITVQSSGEIDLRVPAVGAKMWCLSVFFSLSRSESGGPFARVGYTSNSYCVAIYWSILIPFSPFVRNDCSFRSARPFLFPSLGGATILVKLWYKIAKSPKKNRKSLCTPLCIDSWEIFLKIPPLYFRAENVDVHLYFIFRTSLYSADSNCQSSYR